MFIAKKIWETHEREKKWFGYDITSVRPTVLTQSHNANAPVFVWREVACREAFTTEKIKNTNYKVNLCFRWICLQTWKGKKERKRKQKSGDD